MFCVSPRLGHISSSETDFFQESESDVKFESMNAHYMSGPLVEVTRFHVVPLASIANTVRLAPMNGLNDETKMARQVDLPGPRPNTKGTEQWKP